MLKLLKFRDQNIIFKLLFFYLNFRFVYYLFKTFECYKGAIKGKMLFKYLLNYFAY
jgi:hypothetical protein